MKIDQWIARRKLLPSRLVVRSAVLICAGLLTEDGDDVFDEVVNSGEYLRTTLDRHANHDNQSEHKPGHETNNRGIACEQTRIGSSEFDQTSVLELSLPASLHPTRNADTAAGIT